MKLVYVAIAALLICATNSPSFAAEGDDTKGARQGAGNRFREIAKRFDKDGDGKLNDAEKAELQKFMKERRAKGDGATDRRRPNTQGRPNDARPNRAELVKKFDKDGDGELNEEERKAMMALLRRQGGGNGRINRAELLKKFDKNGDGKLSPEEQQAARKYAAEMRKGQGPTDAARRAAMMKRFDKDGDGELNAEERKAARAAKRAKEEE